MKPEEWQRELAEGELARLVREHPMPTPALEWRGFRTTAGRANFRQWRIELGARVLTTPEALLETLRHEYAHLLAVRRAGFAGRGHGAAWRAAMTELGIAPKRTHSLPVERNAARQRVVYRCRRCAAEIARARRLPKGRRFIHANCGGAIRLERVETISPPAIHH